MRCCLRGADPKLCEAGTHSIELKVSFEFVISLVLEELPQKKQVVLLSATIPDSLRDLTKEIMTNPVKILVKKEQLTLEGIQQFFIDMEKEDWKLDTLCDLYTSEAFTHPTVVFCNSRKRVDRLSAELEEQQLAASATVRILTFNAQVLGK